MSGWCQSKGAIEDFRAGRCVGFAKQIGAKILGGATNSKSLNPDDIASASESTHISQTTNYYLMHT